MLAEVPLAGLSLSFRPGYEFGPGDPRNVARAELCLRVAAAFRGMSADHLSTGLGLAPLTDIISLQISMSLYTTLPLSERGCDRGCRPDPLFPKNSTVVHSHFGPPRHGPRAAVFDHLQQA